jgi:hypothetical protein
MSILQARELRQRVETNLVTWTAMLGLALSLDNGIEPLLSEP